MSLMTAGAEERKPSAFTFSQEIIDAVLTRGSGISEGKMRIYEQFHKSLSAKENADFLKNEYGWGGVYPAIVGADIDEQHDGKGIRISKGIGSDKPHIDLKWSQVEKRIAELIKLDRYLNPKEKAQYPEWLQRQEERRAELAEERRNREILSTAPSEKAEAKNEQYEYHLGSTVYLGANEYEILSFDDERVMLYDTQFPLFNKEMTRTEFDSKVQENPLNDHLKVVEKHREEKAVEFDIGMGYRLICYDILDLGKQLMPIGMLVVLDSILNRITQNRAKGKNTFIFIDEIYLLFQHEYSANFLFTLWKRVRKYGAYATGITQNVDDLLQSHTARTMLANSEFIVMLNQASTDRLELAKLLNISDTQLSYITNVDAGHGLIKVGSSLVPFANKFPKNTKLYKLMTTKPGEGA